MSRIADIAAALAGHDPQALSVDGVHAFLARLATSAVETSCDHVPLDQALGRVLADDVISPIDVPPHDNSAMDGYAFDGAALDDAADTLHLRVAGTVLAGAAWHTPARAGEALRIMTGAVMPAGTDTVVPQERCRVDDQGLHIPRAAVRRGDNRRHAGEDLKAGQPALHRGDRLGPAALGLLASLGRTDAPVHRRLRVALFSTGDELLHPGDAPRAGAVYDSNRYALRGLIAGLGCEPIDLGLVRDDPAALEATLRRAAAEADAIVSSGGVSAGEADHTRAVMQHVGEMAFCSIAMRPGRPMSVGLLPHAGDAGSALLFGLPGNPVAAMVSFLAFVRPALLRMMGCNPAHAAPPPLLRARSATAIRKKPGRTEYQRGFVRNMPGGLPQVRVGGQQGSGVLRSMVEANGLVVLHHAQGDVAPGDEVDVMLFDGVMR